MIKELVRRYLFKHEWRRKFELSMAKEVSEIPETEFLQDPFGARQTAGTSTEHHLTLCSWNATPGGEGKEFDL